MVKRKRNNKKLTLSKVNKKINALLGSVEIKQILYAAQSHSTSTTPIAYDLNIPALGQGVNQDQRVGDKITLTKLQAKIQLQMGQSTITPQDNYNQVRLMVVLYSTQTGNHITMDDILQTPSTLGNPIMTMNSLYRKNPQFKYRVLYDKLHNLYWTNNSGGGGALSGAPKIKNINIVRKLSNEITYDGPLGLPAGWLPTILIASDSAVSVHPEFSMNTRISFKDL